MATKGFSSGGTGRNVQTVSPGSNTSALQALQANYTKQRQAQAARELVARFQPMKRTQQDSAAEPKSKPNVDSRVQAIQQGASGGGGGVSAASSGYDPVTDAGGGGQYVDPASSGGFDTGSYKPTTGFGKQFTAGSVPDLYSDPDALIRAYFTYASLPTTGGAYGQMLQQSDRLNDLFVLLQSNNPAALADPYGNYTDWAGKYLAQQLTPGAARVGQGDIAQALSGAFGDPESVLYQNLVPEGVTPAGQVGNVGSYLNSVMQATAPDVFRAALLSRLASLGDQWRVNAYKSPQDQTFGQFLGDQGFWEMFGK